MKEIRTYGNCEICNRYGLLDEHHKIFKGKRPSLKKCKKNLINLCSECHYSIHHGTNGHQLDKLIKLSFQNYLESIFNKEYFTQEEVQEALDITYSASYSICKSLTRYKGILYNREDIIRYCMSDGYITEEEARGIDNNT